MARGLSSTVLDEIKKDTIIFSDLIELHFTPVKRLTNCPIPVFTATTTTPTPSTYEAYGELLGFDLVTETGEAKVNQINIAISGASNTYTNLFLNNDYVDRRAVIYRAFFNNSMQIVGSPVMLFDGEIQSFSINETGETSTLSVSCASVFYEFTKINGRRTNDTSQKALFPNDDGFKYSAITTEDIKWGKP